jgi:hypothetical protein
MFIVDGGDEDSDKRTRENGDLIINAMAVVEKVYQTESLEQYLRVPVL